MYAVAAMFLLFAAGCDREQRDEVTTKTDAPRVVAELADGSVTRTCIDSNALVPGENVAVLWVPGDRLGVFSTGSSNVLYTNDEKTESVPNTSFSSNDEVVGEIQYAYYPYDSDNNGKEAAKLVGSIPANQAMGQSLHADYKYGKLRGTVVYISPDATENDQMQKVYKAEVVIADDSSREWQVSQGMQCTVEIKTDQRHIIDFFLEPLTDALDRGLKER